MDIYNYQKSSVWFRSEQSAASRHWASAGASKSYDAQLHQVLRGPAEVAVAVRAPGDRPLGLARRLCSWSPDEDPRNKEALETTGKELKGGIFWSEMK